MSHAVYAFLYPTGCLRPTRAMVPVSSSVEVDKIDRCMLEDLDFRELFPTGTVQARLAIIPRTDFRIRNHYTVIAAADSQLCPVNKSLQGRGFQDHRGNVLVVRHASRNPLEITHATSSDLSMVEFVVSQYVIIQPQLSTRLSSVFLDG